MAGRVKENDSLRAARTATDGSYRGATVNRPRRTPQSAGEHDAGDRATQHDATPARNYFYFEYLCTAVFGRQVLPPMLAAFDRIRYSGLANLFFSDLRMRAATMMRDAMMRDALGSKRRGAGRTFRSAIDISACIAVRLNRPERGNAFDQIMLDSSARHSRHWPPIQGFGSSCCAAAGATVPGPIWRRAQPRYRRPRSHVSRMEVLASPDTLPKPTLCWSRRGRRRRHRLCACCDTVIAAEAHFLDPRVRVRMPLGVAVPGARSAIAPSALWPSGNGSPPPKPCGWDWRIRFAQRRARPGARNASLTNSCMARLVRSALSGAAAQYASPTLSTILATQRPDSKTPEALEDCGFAKTQANLVSAMRARRDEPRQNYPDGHSVLAHMLVGGCAPAGAAGCALPSRQKEGRSSLHGPDRRRRCR